LAVVFVLTIHASVIDELLKFIERRLYERRASPIEQNGAAVKPKEA